MTKHTLKILAQTPSCPPLAMIADFLSIPSLYLRAKVKATAHKSLLSYAYVRFAVSYTALTTKIKIHTRSN